jgi:hypothetical protein
VGLEEHHFFSGPCRLTSSLACCLGDEGLNLLVSNLPRDARNDTVEASLTVVNGIECRKGEVDTTTSNAGRTTIPNKIGTSQNFNAVLVHVNLLSTQALAIGGQDVVVNGYNVVGTILLHGFVKGWIERRT